MAKSRKIVNPFFVLLGVAGAIFVVSSLVYAAMTIRHTRAVGSWAGGESSSALLIYFRDNGTGLLMAELVVLAILTVAAIWTDDYWERRARRRES